MGAFIKRKNLKSLVEACKWLLQSCLSLPDLLTKSISEEAPNKETPPKKRLEKTMMEDIYITLRQDSMTLATITNALNGALRQIRVSYHTEADGDGNGNVGS